MCFIIRLLGKCKLVGNELAAYRDSGKEILIWDYWDFSVIEKCARLGEF